MAATPFVMGPAFQADSGSNNPPMLNAVTSTATFFPKGSLLGWDSNGYLVPLGTTPAAGTIIGVAASSNNSAPGINMANQPTVGTWITNSLPYYPASTDTMYASHVVGGSDTYAIPAMNYVGKTYGLRVRADGEPCMDTSLTTTNARVVCRRIDVEGGNRLVFWQFLSTAISQ